MKVIKLTYIAHGWHLGLRQRPLINEQVQAWKYGPVINSVYEAFKKFGGNPIPAQQHANLFDRISMKKPPIVETEFDKIFLDRVWEVYKKYNAVQLSAITHREGSPWHHVAQGHGFQLPANTIIPTLMIQDHYKKIANERSTERTQSREVQA